MARVDYYAIETEIQAVLQAAPELLGAKILVEEELQFGAELTPWIGIYLDRRDAPSPLQALSAGQQTRFLVRFVIWCWEYSLEAGAKTIQLRDDLVGQVEIALMRNRTLNGKVISSWLEGGDLPSMRAPESTGWLAGGEVVLVADVKATTV